MTLTFTHAGRERTLTKHPRIVQQLRAGQITTEHAAASPWYLRVRINGKDKPFRLVASNKQAIADARDILNGQQRDPMTFSDYVAARDARRSVTVGTLARDWTAAGCPFSDTKARTAAQATPLENTIARALEFWAARPWAGIQPQTLEEFVVWRRQKTRQQFGESTQYTGDRSADVQLAALSCLGRWALLTGRVDANPFAKRPRFQERDAIRHCHHAMPANDEELHRILTWLFTHRNEQSSLGNRHRAADVDRHQTIAGACLAFMALTGLRPGEPEHLRRVPAATDYPERLDTATPGLVYPCPDGSRRMKILRLKRGQNPAGRVHAVLEEFLSAWEHWLAAHLPQETVLQPQPLFPITAELVADQLRRACMALGLPPMKPHGFGRAYYVRVRRSQGIDDATIAVELGQSSNGDLIRSVYGDPGDSVGGNRYDWLPAAKDPTTGQVSIQPAAWEHLRPQVPAQILAVNFGKP